MPNGRKRIEKSHHCQEHASIDKIEGMLPDPLNNSIAKYEEINKII